MFSVLQEVYYQKHGVLLVRISNLIDGNVEISSQPIFLPEEYLEKFPEYKLKEDDILIAMSGATTGKVAVNRLNKPALLNQRVGRFVIDNRQLLSLKYLENLVKSITSKVFESAYGGAQPNISAKEIESFKVPIPPLRACLRSFWQSKRHKKAPKGIACQYRKIVIAQPRKIDKKAKADKLRI